MTRCQSLRSLDCSVSILLTKIIYFPSCGVCIKFLIVLLCYVPL